MRRAMAGATAVIAWALIGCGAAAHPAPPEIATTPPSGALPPVAKKNFEEGLLLLAQHDRDNDWSDPVCASTTELFLAEGGHRVAAALYNAGLAQQRCHKDARAQELYRAAVEKDPNWFAARAALARYAAALGGTGIDLAIAELQRAVRDSRFTSVDAQVSLAALLLQRGRLTPDEDGADDFERAKKSLHRALAIDDASMPALNQLALYYLSTAKRRARGEAGGKADLQSLELAALVCSQAIRKNPKDAPIHNTRGLIEGELGNLSQAVAAFNEARRRDPSLFEAHLNAAAVNLRFRGFAQAEEAYRMALRIRPRDYDAHLGLALAIRGQINDANESRLVAAAKKELDEAMAIAPDRPEAYYNDAILTQEYGTRAGGPQAISAILSARSRIQTFFAKAGAASAFAEEKKRAAERLEEMIQLEGFFKATPAAPPPAGGGPPAPLAG